MGSVLGECGWPGHQPPAKLAARTRFILRPERGLLRVSEFRTPWRSINCRPGSARDGAHRTVRQGRGRANRCPQPSAWGSSPSNNNGGVHLRRHGEDLERRAQICQRPADRSALASAPRCGEHPTVLGRARSRLASPVETDVTAARSEVHVLTSGPVDHVEPGGHDRVAGAPHRSSWSPPPQRHCPALASSGRRRRSSLADQDVAHHTGRW